MSRTMISVTLEHPYLAESIRESARRLCRIPDRATLPPERLVAKLTELATEAIGIALTANLERPDTTQEHWRISFNIAVMRHIRTHGVDDLIQQYSNYIDGSYPFVSVPCDAIVNELRLVVLDAAESALMLAYDLDPRLLYWNDEDERIVRALALAHKLGADFLLVMKRHPDEPDGTPQ